MKRPAPLIIFTIVTFATLLLWLGAAYFAGLIAERELTPYLGRRISLYQENCSFALVEYQRGFLSSRARSTMQLGPESGMDRVNSEIVERGSGGLELQHHLRHGPLPPTNPESRKLSWGLPLLAEISTLGTRPGSPELQLQARTTIDMRGTITTFFRLNPSFIEYETAGVVGGVEGVLFCRREQTDTGREVITVELTLRGERVELMGEIYGPLEMELRAGNLDMAALSGFFELTPWLAGLVADPSGGDLPPQAAQTLVESITTLLEHSPELKLNLTRLKTPSGRLEARLNMSYREREKREIFHPAMLLSGLEMDFEARGPATLEQSHPQYFQALRQRGYPVTTAGERFSFSLQLREGELKLNGQPAPARILRRAAGRLLFTITP